jgi:hypothetical protein
MNIKPIIDAIAIAGNLIGSLLVALSSHNPHFAVIGYTCFLFGSVASAWLLMHSTASKSLLFVNLYFTVINVIGIATRM